MATTIRLISARWLNNAKSELSTYAKDSPNREAKVAEIAEAQKHFDARCAVEALAKKQGFRPNSYEKTCRVSGVVVKPSCGFVRKEGNQWVTYSFAVVQEIVGYTFEG